MSPGEALLIVFGGAVVFIATCETVRWWQLRARRSRRAPSARYVRKPTLTEMRAGRRRG